MCQLPTAYFDSVKCIPSCQKDANFCWWCFNVRKICKDMQRCPNSQMRLTIHVMGTMFKLFICCNSHGVKYVFYLCHPTIYTFVFLLFIHLFVYSIYSFLYSSIYPEVIAWSNVCSSASEITRSSMGKLYWKLTHWGRVTHMCVSKLTIIGSDNGLSPGRRQAIIWTNAGILLIWPLGTNFSEISIDIKTFSFKKIHLKMSSGKWRPSCLGLNVLKAKNNTTKLRH